MNRIRIGIVGSGAIASRVHIPVLSTFVDVHIAAIAEINTKRAEKFARKYSISEIYADYREMYKKSDLDGVFICLPNSLHYNATRDALENGINAFCEKPMSTDADSALELVKIANEKDLILAVGYNKRCENSYEDTIKIARSLRIGKILQISGSYFNPGPYAGWIPSSDWFLNDKYGVVYDLGSHLFDLILSIISDKIIEIYAIGTGNMYRMDIYDNISGNFKTEKGIIGTFNFGWRTASVYDAIQIHGTGGSIFANSLELELRHGSYNPLDAVTNHINVEAAMKIIGKYVEGIGESAHPSKVYFKEDRAFIDAIIKKGNPIVSGEDGLTVLEVLGGIRESLEKGAMVKIKFHNDR